MSSLLFAAHSRLQIFACCITLFFFAGLPSRGIAADAKSPVSSQPLYTYTLSSGGSTASYDEALAVASLQGVINRRSPELYVLSAKNSRPQFWLDLLSKDGRWLERRPQQSLPDLAAIVKLAGPRIKGAVIWDPAVPATVNVATTIAGVEDAVVLSPDFADRYLSKWHLPVIKDLRGQFTGSDVGSVKNDAYRWAIREYLAKGACSSHLLCLFEDAFTTRAHGDIGYVVTRDWAVRNRAFVFDLSPWGDEVPGDDPHQHLGTDLDTYKMILAEIMRQAAGKQMTEMTGFFAFSKYSATADHNSAHLGVPTEWESVWLISPYNCYQNTISSDCFNQSIHSQAPRRQLKQNRKAASIPLEKKAYVCILMSDYDSATPLYDFLPTHWNDPDRGKIPLAWGINPDLLETYPDLIAYYYSTATPDDTFTSDASAAGYMNPNRIAKDQLPLFIRHNQRLFQEADMDIAPMVLDRDQPTAAVKDAFQQFAPSGYATIVADVNGARGTYPAPQVWKGMPILELLNDTCNSKQPDQIANIIAGVIQSRGNPHPGFYFFRTTWINPSDIVKADQLLHAQHPELNVELLDPHTFFALFKKAEEVQGSSK